MSAINSIHVVGNLVASPELRYTKNERPVVNARLAVNERIQRDGEWHDRTNFVNLVVWGAQAENLAGSVDKGDRVMVTGRLTVREYTTTEGERRFVTEIVADEVGYSLRWASCEGTRNERSALVGAGADPVYGDEEPF